MFEKPTARLLPDGKRLLLQQGPIDLVIQAAGDTGCVKAAYEAAIHRFDGLLEDLCGELPLLRSPIARGSPVPEGVVARRMHAAVLPFAVGSFITPMAAVAGSVAEEILGAMTSTVHISRAYVNNGGDIALHLADSESFRIGLVDRPDRPNLFGTATLSATDGIGGIATSGYLGRSFSRGIAEAVTVLAPTAAMADAAATVIANAVDLAPDHPAIRREPACSIQSDSDLGDILVTRDVAPLPSAEIEAAISAGLRQAELLRRSGLITAAAIHLQRCTGMLSIPTLMSTVQGN